MGAMTNDGKRGGVLFKVSYMFQETKPNIKSYHDLKPKHHLLTYGENISILFLAIWTKAWKFGIQCFYLNFEPFG
jgi:hypothetical protein